MTIKIKSLDTHADGTLVVPNKLGIGTSSPANMLDIVGQYAAQFSGYQVFTTWRDTNDANKGFRIQTAGGNTLFSTDASGGGTYTERMRITSSGNVGIGTSSPSEKLHITNGNFAIDKSLYGGYLKWTQGTTSPRAGYWEWGDGTGWRMDFGPPATPRLSIYDNGNVGIGTSSPNQLLTVAGQVRISYSSSYTGMNISNKSASASVSAVNFLDFGNENEYAVAALWGEVRTDGGSSLGIHTTPAGSRTSDRKIERMRVDYNGNVGIGTSSPAHPFHLVVGSSSYLCVDTSTAANTGFLIRDSGINKWLMNHDSGTGRLYVVDSNLNDGVYMSQNTTSWTANSDNRLKDVKGTITNALDKVQQLTGVKFTWKRDQGNPDAKVRVGLIAQDVQVVLPEAVDDESPDLITDEETGKISGGLGVRYTELVPLLVNAIKELTARVVTLEQAAA